MSSDTFHTLTASAETQQWEELRGQNKEDMSGGDINEEEKVEQEGEEEDLLEITGARGIWTKRAFLLCASG